MKSKLFLIICFLLALRMCPRNIINNGLDSYRKECPEMYSRGLDVSKKILDELNQKNYKDSRFATAIIFPELMRYSAKRNEAETFITEILYSSGTEYFNCSIGRFQMKPAFASKIEILLDENQILVDKYNNILFHGKDDDLNSRLSRVKRLQNYDFQIDYLCAFIDLSILKYKLEDKETKYKLKIISAAYNWGLEKKLNELEKLSEINAYPEGQNSKQSKWCYSQIVEDFYFNYESRN